MEYNLIVNCVLKIFHHLPLPYLRLLILVIQISLFSTIQDLHLPVQQKSVSCPVSSDQWVISHQLSMIQCWTILTCQTGSVITRLSSSVLIVVSCYLILIVSTIKHGIFTYQVLRHWLLLPSNEFCYPNAECLQRRWFKIIHNLWSFKIIFIM